MGKDIEGLDFEIEGDILSKKKLEEVWKTLTDKPLPKVSAIVLENGEFF